MRDQTIVKLINNSREDLLIRMQVLEKLLSDTTFQTIGIIMLIRSIPVLGDIIIKLLERNIKKYQRIVQKQAVKQYQEQKKENKNGNLDNITGQNKG